MLTPLKKRYIFHDEIGDRFKLFSECVAYVESKLAEPERAHLTEEQRKQVNDKVKLVSDFMAALQAEISSKPKHQDPSTTLDEVDKKLRVLKAECDPILNTPKPAPKEDKKEEAPKEEKPAEAEKADDPMTGDQPQPEAAPETKEL